MVVPQKVTKKDGLDLNNPYMVDDIIQDANSYYSATIILEDIREKSSLFPPVILNAAFACELFSKAILYKNGRKPPIINHQLKGLYDDFPKDIKSKIKEQYQNGNEVRFEEWLADINEIFEFWRYRYEHKKYSTHYSFLLEYMKVLKLTVEGL